MCFNCQGRQANHSKDKKIQKELGQLCHRIEATLNSDTLKND
jgi:hypothetical protein